MRQKNHEYLFLNITSLPSISHTMASGHETWSMTGAGNFEAPAVQEQTSLHHNSECVVYMFFGKDQRDPESVSSIWLRMMRQDLVSPEIFQGALTQYILSAIDLGMTHYYPYLGDVFM